MPRPAPLQAKPRLPEIPAPAAAPTPAPAPQPGQVTSISALQEQVASYAQQLAGLRAQRNVLQRQISASTDGTTRAALELRKVPLEQQIAQTEIDLESARAQLRSRQSQYTVQNDFRPPPRRGMDPDVAAGLLFAFIFAVLMPISIAIARRIWRGKKDVAPRVEDSLSPRFDRLEQAVDAIAIEVERISEGQRFVTKVLVERPGSERPSTVRPTQASEKNDATSVAEPKPFLALGAGPAEPIRVAERQAVRQWITPH